MIDKKKLKEDYKNLIHPKGIFVIRNNISGRVYLGSSLNLYGILEKNRFVLNMGGHKNIELQEDWKKFGSDSFTLEIVETLPLKDDPDYNYKEDLQILEMLWIDKFKPLNENCYNKDERIRTV